jgi:hypothetical protein
MGFGIEKSKGGGNYTPCPQGSYAGRCSMVVDLGWHLEEYMGKPKKYPTKKIRIGFETPTQLHTFIEEKGPEPFMVSKKWTNTDAPKGTFVPALNLWRGKNFTPEAWEKFQISDLLGAPALITIIHKPSAKDATKIYANLASIIALPKGMVCPPAIMKPILFSVDPAINPQGKNHPDFALLPEFVQDECLDCLEWNPDKDPRLKRGTAPVSQAPAGAQQPPAPEEDENLPF